MNSKRYFVLFLLLATMLLAGLVACQTEEAEEPQETTTGESPVSEVNNLAVGGFGRVSAEGEVVPLSSTDLSFQVGGNVAEIMVEQGDALVTGEPDHTSGQRGTGEWAAAGRSGIGSGRGGACGGADGIGRS